MPRQTFITGDIDIHEVGVDGEGQPIFVNTSFVPGDARFGAQLPSGLEAELHYRARQGGPGAT